MSILPELGVISYLVFSAKSTNIIDDTVVRERDISS